MVEVRVGKRYAQKVVTRAVSRNGAADRLFGIQCFQLIVGGQICVRKGKPFWTCRLRRLANPQKSSLCPFFARIFYLPGLRATHPEDRSCVPGGVHRCKPSPSKLFAIFEIQRDSFPELGLSQVWGSSSNRGLGRRSIGRVEPVSEAGSERAIVDGAADLEEEIGPSSGPAHLLRFVHPAVDQEVGGAFGDGGTDAQAGAVPFGVMDHPVALPGEIAVERAQGGPQLSRGRGGGSSACFALKRMHDRADPLD